VPVAGNGVVETGAPRPCRDVLPLVVPGSRRFGPVGLKPFEVLLHDEVDDARDGIGTVCRRRTAGDDFDALDEAGGNLIEIWRRVTRWPFARGLRRAGGRRRAPRCAADDAAQVRRGNATGGRQTARAIAEILSQVIGEVLGQQAE